MASEVEICNMALAQVRARSINSLNEASVEAQQCSLHYNIARDQALSDYDWGFNNKRIPLAQLEEEIFNWAFIWAYPSDCLNLNYLIRNIEEVASSANTSLVALRFDLDHRFRVPSKRPAVEYELFTTTTNGKVIATKEGEIRADYRARIEDPNQYSIDFRIALSYLLGSMLAIPIVGEERGRNLRSDALSLYDSFINRGKMKSQNQRHEATEESDYITIREEG